jgi:hypothetical protein
MITPEILPNDSPGVTPNLPRYPETFLPPVSDRQVKPTPPAAFSQTSRSQAMVPAAAPVVVDNRTEIEKAQDRALAALDKQNQQTVAAAPVVNEKSGVTPAAPQTMPANAVAPQAVAAPQTSEPATQVAADVIDLSKEQRELEKAAREQAERDAKVADKARKEDAKRAAAAQAEMDKLVREQAKREAEEAKKQAKRDAEEAEKQAKRDAKAAKQQAKADAEAAKLQARQDAEMARLQAEAAKAQAKADRDAGAAAQRQASDAKRDAEREQERQQAIDAAAERLRAAEAEYQAELARRSQR